MVSFLPPQKVRDEMTNTTKVWSGKGEKNSALSKQQPIKCHESINYIIDIKYGVFLLLSKLSKDQNLRNISYFVIEAATKNIPSVIPH